jgi:crotonobetainyl-CoA:carnitine CoA-transferase CaiB-like acyl-CoA transferase
MADGADGGAAGPGALAGVRVVDLTTVLMGPLASRILGDHDADVIRVESLQGDSVRNSLPARSPGMSGMGLNLHRNKRSVSLDLKTAGGRDAAARIAATADVFVTNMRRQALLRLGLDAATLRAEHPALIHCVANGYGSDGPYADRPAYDDAIQAGSGLAWLTAQVGDRPVYVPAIVADKVCGMAIAQAVLAALVHRGRTGEGQAIEIPMLETMVAFNLMEHQRGTAYEPPLGPFGYDRLLNPYRRPYRTADGWAAILPYNDAQWLAFFRISGREDLADDVRFADHNARIAHISDLYRVVDEVAPSRTTAEWLRLCAEAGIPASEVMDLAHATDDPHLAAVGMFEVVEHPTEGAYRHVRDGSRLGATPTGLHRFAPHLGEHTVEVLNEAGLSREEVGALLGSGAAYQHPGVDAAAPSERTPPYGDGHQEASST